MRWAWTWPLSPTQKLTLVALAWHSDGHGHCWPSQARLARLSGLSERTVRRAVRDLETQQLLRRHKRTTEAGAATSDLYVLQLTTHPPDTVTAPSGQADLPVRTDKVAPPGQGDRQKGLKGHLKGWEKIEQDRQRAEEAADVFWSDQEPAQDRERWLRLLKGTPPETS